MRKNRSGICLTARLFFEVEASKVPDFFETYDEYGHVTFDSEMFGEDVSIDIKSKDFVLEDKNIDIGSKP